MGIRLLNLALVLLRMRAMMLALVSVSLFTLRRCQSSGGRWLRHRSILVRSHHSARYLRKSQQIWIIMDHLRSNCWAALGFFSNPCIFDPLATVGLVDPVSISRAEPIQVSPSMAQHASLPANAESPNSQQVNQDHNLSPNQFFCHSVDDSEGFSSMVDDIAFRVWKCQNCFSMAHITSSCTNQTRCCRCFRQGHGAKSCTRSAPAGVLPGSRMSLRVHLPTKLTAHHLYRLTPRVPSIPLLFAH